MTILKYAACAALGFFLTACGSVGPDYRVPSTALVKAPEAKGNFVGLHERARLAGEVPLFSDQPVSGVWWRLYQDPVLNNLVHQALIANTDLRIAAANIARSRALLERAEDAQTPSTKIDAGFDYGRISAEQYLLTQTIPDLGTYDMGFGISYQLDLFGQIRRAVEAARVDTEVAYAAYDVARITVAAETTRAYAEACATGHELAVARHSLDLQRKSYSLTERLVSVGRTGSTELTRSGAQVEQFRANIPSLLAQHQTALFQLATLTAHPPAAFPREVETCDKEPVLRAVIPVGDGAALLRRRPDIREAERRLAAATARIGVATGDLYPKITFGLTAGSTGAINDFLSAPTLRYGLGPLINWEFPNQNLARSRIAEARASAQAELARFDGTVLKALREVETALVVYARDLDRHSALAAAEAQSVRAVSDAESLYIAGRQSYLPVLDAERTLAGVDQALASAESKVALDQVTLFLVLGGGWEQPSRS